jgi:hypothetical protein
VKPYASANLSHSNFCYAGLGKLKIPMASEIEPAAFWLVAQCFNQQTNSVACVLERTIPTERPPLAGEVGANFSGEKGVAIISAADPLRP